MKKILIILFFILFACTQAVFADSKISSVNYDTSANLLFLAFSGSENFNSQIKLVKLSNPKRIYFDIENTVLTCENQNYNISSGGSLRQIVVSQNSTKPNIVRVVLYFSEDYNINNLKILKVNNNIIIKINKEVCYLANYMHTSYRDEKFENTDFYSFLSMSTQIVNQAEKPAIQNASTTPEKVLNQIQMAFENSTIPVNVKTSPQYTKPTIIKKDLKLRTGYYLTGISSKDNGILLSGIGNIAIEKPMVLTNPTRLIFDLPNTLSVTSLRSQVFKHNEDTVRIGQFEANKARIVITTPNPDNYIPIYSTDAQSVLIADKNKLNHEKLSNIATNLASTKFTQISDKNCGLNFYFTKPVTYSVKRTNSTLTIYFFNAVQYNEQNFKSIVNGTDLSNAKMYLMPKTGLRFTIPIDAQDTVKVYSGADARTIKLSINMQKNKVSAQKMEDIKEKLPTKDGKSEIKDKNENSEKAKPVKIKRKSGERVVVIDPGHGGVDYGAIRSGINEKDITTDVSNRVYSILRSKGYTVHLTRTEDKTLSLQARVDFAEEISPDIFISIHVNSSNGTTATGIETHYYHDYSIPLAKVIHASMTKYINSKDRGLFKSKFYVINHTTMPAILVEIGFISNDEERADLISEKRKQATANAIAEGIVNYYKQQLQQK